MKYRRFPVVMLLLAMCSAAWPQFAKFEYDRITREDGLGHNQVECIYQDSYGFVWFGTRNGLCRYDGFNITTFRNTSDSASISGNRILSIAGDSDGNLWIGTFQNGVNKYLRETGTFIRYETGGSPGTRVNSVEIMEDRSVWICTDNGLGRYMPETDAFMVYLPDPDDPGSINSNQVSDILESSDGCIYVATWSNTIQRFDAVTGTFTEIPYERDPELNVDFRKHIVEDRKGHLWISANKHGVCRLDPVTGESELYTSRNSGLSTDILNGNMMIDEMGRIWIATDGRGINVYDPELDKFFYLDDGPGSDGRLPGNQVYCIYQDMQNQIWIGFYDKGVIHYDPARRKFDRSLYQQDDLKVFLGMSVLCMFQDSNDYLWIGTDGDGLFRMDSEAGIIQFRNRGEGSESISSDVITSIGEDASGNILAGTYATGFNIYNPSEGSWQHIPQGTANASVNSSTVWEIYKDSRDNIWLGLLGNGVDLYNSETGNFTNMGVEADVSNRVNHPNIMVIMEDSDGDIWFGTEGNGVNILDRQTNTMTEPALSGDNKNLQSAMIRSLYQDYRGRIWIGTEGDGLYVYNKKSGELISMVSECVLNNMIVTGILQDDRRNYWITTGNGLCRYNEGTGKWLHFYTSDGLSANEFNADAMLRLRDGRILAGSVNGLDIIDPETMVINQNIPRVVLTRLEIMNKKIEPGEPFNNRIILNKQITYTDQLTLRNTDKIFTIEFAALNFTHPEKCEFEYRLKGFEEEWVPTTYTRRYATYSNLKPGTYTFMVRASNNDGKWGYNTRELIIEVEPPFWATWWFILLVSAVIISIAAYIYVTRLNAYKNSFLKKQALQEKRIVELEKENLELELKKLAFFRLSRNRNLLELKNRLEGISRKSQTPLKDGLENIIGEIDQEITTDKDWKLIEPQLDITYNNFLTKLRERHTDLTLSELKIAAYVRMNLSTKEIAEHMHKTIRAIENDRYRLRKKLGLEPKDSLKEYLSSL